MEVNAGALLAAPGRMHGVQGWLQLLEYGAVSVGHESKHFKLLQKDDAVAWLVFACTISFLIVLGNLTMSHLPTKVGLVLSAIQTCFYVLVTVVFGVFVFFYRRSLDDMLAFYTGFVIEYTLSLDTMFIYHMIFNVYKTPEQLKRKPLFCGVIFAIFCRFILFYIQGTLLRYIEWAYYIIGIILMYMGANLACAEEDESSDLRDSWLFRWLTSHFRIVNSYGTGDRFFVRLAVTEDAEQILWPNEHLGSVNLDPVVLDDLGQRIPCRRGSFPLTKQTLDMASSPRVRRHTAGWLETPRHADLPPRYGATQGGPVKYRWHATLLFAVTVCLELTDLFFAVDSVTCVVAQIPDLFLAFTSSVFAMLGLRSLFFLLDRLLHLLRLMKYGVALMLVFIGAKLMFREYYEVPMLFTLIFLITTLLASMAASVVYTRYVNVEDELTVARREFAKTEARLAGERAKGLWK